MQDHSAQFMDHVRQVMARRLDAVGVLLTNEIKQLISIPSRTVRQAEITKGKNKGKTKTMLGPRGSDRSMPGDPPHKDYGVLRSSIAWQTDREKMVVRVGTNLAYGRYLELGTKKMKARPFLRKALKENNEAIRQILEHGERTQISVGD